ncbi:DUF305 domain-containing protein [Streptomyces noursei]|nr:DUF305 domain-containing protein [Streptomyces noursei]
MNSFRPRHATMAAAAAVAALVLAACGGNGSKGGGSPSPTATPSGPTASASAGQHNRADVAFAQGMIPHHRQAVVMANMAEQHASSGEVKSLAEKIRKAQQPEIDTMAGWLKAWGEQVPPGQSGTGPGSPTGMPGMMSDQQMDALRDTTGAAFDKMFLTMMISHHQGAIKMANTEKQQGAYGPAKEMAGNIATSQTAEIAQMRKMLGTGSPSPTGY